MSVLSLREAWEDHPRLGLPARPSNAGFARSSSTGSASHATTALDPKDVTFTANDVLADARAGVLKEAVTMSGWGEEVQVIAAEPALEHRNRPEGKGSELRLRKAMNGTPSAYDLVLIDTPPSLGELTKNALAASQRALVVAEPSLFALQGAQQALDAVDVVRRGFNLRLRTIGIVANRVRPTSEHRFRLDELATAYGDLVFDPAMLDRSAVMQAQGACVPVQRWHSRGARAASHVLSTYLDRVLATRSGTDPRDGKGDSPVPSVRNPSPRPALRKAPDGHVHPAAPRLGSLPARLQQSWNARTQGKERVGHRRTVKDKPVDVVVPMPKSMRKRLKTRAAEQGMTAEDAAFHVLRVWLTS